MLYSETVKCFRREWLLPNDHESDEMLQKRLYNSETNPTDENKKAFINLARSQKYFSCFQFGPCFWLVEQFAYHKVSRGQKLVISILSSSSGQYRHTLEPN